MPDLSDAMGLLNFGGGLINQIASIAGLIQQYQQQQARIADPRFGEIEDLFTDRLERSLNEGGVFGQPLTGFDGSFGLHEDGSPVMGSEVVLQQLVGLMQGNAGASNALLSNIDALRAGTNAPQLGSLADLRAGRGFTPSQPFDRSTLQAIPSPVATEVGTLSTTATGGPGTNLQGVPFEDTREPVVLSRSTPTLTDAQQAEEALGDVDLEQIGEAVRNIFQPPVAPPATASPFGPQAQPGAPGRGQFASFAQGTPFVQQDQLAQVHQGEMIVPANQNPFNQQLPVPQAPQAPAAPFAGPSPGPFQGQGQAGIIPPRDALPGQQQQKQIQQNFQQMQGQLALPAPAPAQRQLSAAKGGQGTDQTRTTQGFDGGRGDIGTGTADFRRDQIAADEAARVARLSAAQQEQEAQILAQRQAEARQMLANAVTPEEIAQANVALQAAGLPFDQGIIDAVRDNAAGDGTQSTAPVIPPRDVIDGFTTFLNAVGLDTGSISRQIIPLWGEYNASLGGATPSTADFYAFVQNKFTPAAEVVEDTGIGIPEQIQPLLDALAEFGLGGGPLNADVVAQLKGVAGDVASRQLQAGQRDIQSNLGARGFGDSGLLQNLLQRERLASQAGVRQGEIGIDINAALTNRQSQLQALGQAVTGNIGGLSQELAQQLGLGGLGINAFLADNLATQQTADFNLRTMQEERAITEQAQLQAFRNMRQGLMPLLQLADEEQRQAIEDAMDAFERGISGGGESIDLNVNA